jgi:DNA (cytosine-5)-methyltransferase 1
VCNDSHTTRKVGLDIMTHVDLFSGIGGFALAAKWAGFETTVFCEKDIYCQKVLHKHWPDVPIIDDIKDFNGTEYSGTTLLTGGVPCQPASEAGKRKGKKDDRWLWPEALRVIRESRPNWVVLENVRGLISLNGGVEFENLLLELETIGYEVRAFVVPACAVGASHRRDRVWIIANTDSNGWLGRSNNIRKRPICSDKEQQTQEIQQTGNQRESGVGEVCEVLADTKGIRLNNGDDGKLFGQATRKIYTSSGTGSNSGTMEAWEWKTDTGICRISDGSRDRVDRLRALGNAIVPQVAYEIIRSIAIIENNQND